jgi:hypothetical protein
MQAGARSLNARTRGHVEPLHRAVQGQRRRRRDLARFPTHLADCQNADSLGRLSGQPWQCGPHRLWPPRIYLPGSTKLAAFQSIAIRTRRSTEGCV